MSGVRVNVSGSKFKKSAELIELENIYNSFVSLDKPKVYFYDHNTNELQKSVFAYAYLLGMFVEVCDNKARYYNGKYVPGRGVKGTSDLHAIRKGRAYRIELKCKATKDRQSKDQKKYEQGVLKAEGVYLIVTTFKDFYDFVKEQGWEI